MIVIVRPLFLIGIAVSLGACARDQAFPLEPQTLFSPRPATVRSVQIALRERGYYAGPVDGSLGQDVGIGIERFQIDHCQRATLRLNRPLLVGLGIVREEK